MSFKELVKAQIKSRAGYKSRISLTIKDLNQELIDGHLTADLFEREQKKVFKWLDQIDEINTAIADTCDNNDIDHTNISRLSDVENEQLYCSQIQSELSAISSQLTAPKPLPQADPSHDALVNAIAKLQSNPVKPKLQCSQFSGQNVDKLEFKNFLTQFNNCVDSDGSLLGSAKLTYLRSYLTGYAYKIISHLSITDANYDVAIALLKR